MSRVNAELSLSLNYHQSADGLFAHSWLVARRRSVMSSFFRKTLLALVALSLLQIASPAHAGLFKKLGAVGAAVVGVEAVGIADATVGAISVVGTAAYISTVTDLKSKVAAHRFIGPTAVKLGIAAWLRLEPRRLAAALAVKSDTIGSGGSGSSQSTSLGNSATGDPNDEEPEQPGHVVVKRPLRADDFGLQPQNISELRGQVLLEGRTLTVRVDMIRGVPTANGFTLETSGPQMINSLRALASDNGATTLRIEGSIANDRLLRVLELRYGARVETIGPTEIIVLPVS
jgi:hypothetical protein